jgi:ketosteroid isomerase-like protein
MDSNEAQALVGRLLDGLNKGDMGAIESCLHPDAVAEFPFAPAPMSPMATGLEAVMAMFRAGRANFKSMMLTPGKSYWCPEQSSLVLEATSEAELAGGGRYGNRYVFVIGIQADRIILWREYFDSLIVANAMAGASATG